MKPRIVAALATLAVVALGIASRRVELGFSLWDKSLGDVLYAVMVYLVALFVRPRARPASLGAFTFALCFAIELFQRTGIPLALPRIFRWILGTTFAWHDVACYAVGAVVAAGIQALATRPKKKNG